MERGRGSLKDCSFDCNYKSGCGITRINVVPIGGDGSGQINIMFVGRDPGNNENIQKVPFVGDAGKFIRMTINAVFGENGEDKVFITNLVKCHTENNIGPNELDVKHCAGNLRREIARVRPAVVVALGETVSSYFIGRFLPTPIKMKSIVGKRYIVKYSINKVDEWKMIILPCYHPSPRNIQYYSQIRDVVKDAKRISEISQVTRI